MSPQHHLSTGTFIQDLCTWAHHRCILHSVVLQKPCGVMMTDIVQRQLQRTWSYHKCWQSDMESKEWMNKTITIEAQKMITKMNYMYSSSEPTQVQNLRKNLSKRCHVNFAQAQGYNFGGRCPKIHGMGKHKFKSQQKASSLISHKSHLTMETQTQRTLWNVVKVPHFNVPVWSNNQHW